MRMITPILIVLLFMAFYAYMPHYDAYVNLAAMIISVVLLFLVSIYYIKQL